MPVETPAPDTPEEASAADAVYVAPAGKASIAAADILVSEFMARAAPNCTYWATQNWNAGGKFGGYGGFQQSPSDGRKIITSLWDHKDVKGCVELFYRTPEGESQPFGGEGTGRQLITPYPWESDSWYRLVFRCWDDDAPGRGTCLGQWVYAVDGSMAGKWFAAGALRYPTRSERFSWGLGLFQEDWCSTGKDHREFRLRNCWSRNAGNGQWEPWTELKVTGKNINKDWDGGFEGKDYCWGAAGGNTVTPPEKVEHGVDGTLDFTWNPQKDDATTVTFGNPRYQESHASTITVPWIISSDQVPQLSYELQILDKDGNKIPHVEPKKRTDPFCHRAFVTVGDNVKPGSPYKAQLTVENVYGRTTTISKPFTA
ncbi:DUF3472 domain-containing protein [Streptomyces hiroshimensis]|nr:DUF3472 domain-containing protein [Streptomyces hiroshimensis]